MGVTTETGLGRVGGDSEGLLAGRGVGSATREVSPARAPAGCQLAPRCLPWLRRQRSTRNPPAPRSTAAFPGTMPSPGLPCRVYPCALTHPWENKRDEAGRE